MNSHRRLTLWSALIVAALTMGCSGGGLFARAAPAEDVEFARSYLALFAARAYPAIEMGMDPSLKDPQIRQKIVQMASVFPPGEPKSVRVASSRSSATGNDTTSTLTFQYEYPDRWILADVVVQRHSHAPVVAGVHIQAQKDSLERLNRLTFAGKGPAHVLALVAWGLLFLFVLWTFVEVIRSPAPGMKWAWAAFVLVGFGRFAFNWSTGALTIVPMSIQLLGSTFSKGSSFEPLILSTSIPVGAIVYLVQRREWRQDGAIPPPPGP